MCSAILSSFTSSHDLTSIFDFNTWYLHHSSSGTSFQGSSSFPADERMDFLQVSTSRVDICRSRTKVKSSSTVTWQRVLSLLIFFFRRIFLLIPSMMKCFLHLTLAYLHDNYRSLRISEIDNLNSVYPPQNLCKYNFSIWKTAKLHLDLFHHNISVMTIKS